MMRFFICTQFPDGYVEIIDCFQTFEEATESLEFLTTEIPGQNFWISQVPAVFIHQSEPILY
jgi:hypothetical protein